MSSNWNERFKRPEIGALSQDEINRVIQFTKSAFGCSEWIARGGAYKPYYFNLDMVFRSNDREKARDFFDILANRIQMVADYPDYREVLDGRTPVIGYVCPSDSPTGVVQARGALLERLGWPSILIYPDKRVLRSRVISSSTKNNFPESVKWLKGRNVILTSDAATTGESIARCKGVLRSFGCQILAAVAVYDRDEGAVESLENIRIPLYSVYGANDLLDSLIRDTGTEGTEDHTVLLERVQEAIQSKAERDYSVFVSLSS